MYLGPPLFLSPLIQSGRISEAQSMAKVTSEEITKITQSYSGYLTVNKAECESNLFFWFFPAKVTESDLKIKLN